MTIRPPKVQRFQGFPDAKQGRGVSFPVPPLFRPHTVNILEEINMDKNQGYAILKKDNPAVGKRMERKPSISQQMQEAGRQAQERQAPPTPKREAPDRGER